MKKMLRNASRAAMVAGVVTACTVGLSAAPSGAATRSTVKATTPPICATPGVRVHVYTNQFFYAPGSPVTITETIKNVSRSVCTIGIGPVDGQAPGLYILDQNGNQVWYDCDVDDAPGMCLFYWQLLPFEPGQVWTRTYTWDQGTSTDGGPVHQVAPGMYSVTSWWASVGQGTGAPAPQATTDIYIA